MQISIERILSILNAFMGLFKVILGFTGGELF